MNNTHTNSLHLETLQDSVSNVTVGFRCTAGLKQHLTEEAESLGFSLSSYVNNLVTANQELIDEISDSFEEKVNDGNKLNEELMAKIRVYENDILQDLFEVHKNQTVKFKNSNGVEVSQEVLKIEDVYSILINSFKTKR